MKKRIAKNFVLSTGALALMLFTPAAPKSAVGQAISTVTNQIEVQAAQTYSDNWKVDAMGNWHFYNDNDDGSLVVDSWVHDYGEWYLLDSNGTMRTGVFRSNGGKYYVLDTVRGTGTYGKLLKDGMVYQGVVLRADTSAAYEGALTDETLQQLAAVGVDVINVPNVENTKHVDKDADRGGSTATDTIKITSSEGAEGGYYNSQGFWVPPEVVALNFSKAGDCVEIDGTSYMYAIMRKEILVIPHDRKDADRGGSVPTDTIQITSSEGAEGGYYNSQGYWVPPEVVAMNLNKSSGVVEMNGILYCYDTLRKEIEVTPPLKPSGLKMIQIQ